MMGAKAQMKGRGSCDYPPKEIYDMFKFVYCIGEKKEDAHKSHLWMASDHDSTGINFFLTFVWI